MRRGIADQKGQYHKGEKWHLKKGSKGVPIEYWYLYNMLDGKKYTLEEYQKAIKNGDFEPSDFIWKHKTFTVFHNTKNHLSYVQSWISVLENDPNELFSAIKDSDKIVEYLEKKSEIDRFIKLDFKHEPTEIQLEQDTSPAQSPSPQEVAKNARERAKKRNNSDKSKKDTINSNRQVMSR